MSGNTDRTFCCVGALFECWWVATVSADHIVNKRHSNAIFLESAISPRAGIQYLQSTPKLENCATQVPLSATPKMLDSLYSMLCSGISPFWWILNEVAEGRVSNPRPPA